MPCTASNSGEVDLDRLADAVARHEPRWLVVGSSWPLFPYPLAEIEAIAAEAGARILYDAAHVLGLVAGGCYQHPLREGAAALTASTHKTFPGPVGGIILTNDDDLASRIHDFTDRAIGNYHNQRAAALAVTLAEMVAFGQAYAAATVENAGALARALDTEGFEVVGRERGFTRSHVVVLDLEGTMTPAEAVKRLETVRITCEAIPLPRDFPRAVALRLGSPSLTRRGMGPGENGRGCRLSAPSHPGARGSGSRERRRPGIVLGLHEGPVLLRECSRSARVSRWRWPVVPLHSGLSQLKTKHASAAMVSFTLSQPVKTTVQRYQYEFRVSFEKTDPASGGRVRRKLAPEVDMGCVRRAGSARAAATPLDA